MAQPITQQHGAATRPVRTAFGATTTTIACVLPVFLVGGLAVQLAEDLHFSPAGLGLAVSIYFATSAVASLPAGYLVERLGPRMAAQIAIALSGGSLLAAALLARSYALLTLFLALSAGSNALGQLASNAALARQVPPGRQGLSFGVKQAAIPLSTLLAGAAVPTIALTAGWRWAFVAAGTTALATLAAVPRSADGGTRAARHSERRASAPLLTIGAAATLASGAANGLGTFLVDSTVARGISPGLAGLTLTLGSVICVAGRVFFGWLGDKRRSGHLATVAAMLLVGACGLTLLTKPNPAALILGVALGFGFGWAWPGVMNFAVVQIYPQAPAAATSVTQTGVYAGGALGPLALGAIAEHASYPTMWLTAAGAMLLAAALMVVGGQRLRAAAARHA
ncbi:MAG TPA: MFS transporter [Micromonospora sp.]